MLITRSLLPPLSLHLFLQFITPGRSSCLHPVSAQSCFMEVFADCPALMCPQENITYELILIFPAVPSMSCSCGMGSKWP